MKPLTHPLDVLTLLHGKCLHHEKPRYCINSGEKHDLNSMILSTDLWHLEDMAFVPNPDIHTPNINIKKGCMGEISTWRSLQMFTKMGKRSCFMGKKSNSMR